MKRLLKWGFIVVGSLVVLIVAALLIIPRFVDVMAYTPMLEERVTQATGRPFSIGDDLNLSLFPWVGVSFSNLQLGNTPQFKEKEFVTIQQFEARVKVLPLLSKTIEVKRFVVNEPRFVLVKNQDGRVNWAQPSETDKPSPPAQESPGEVPTGELPIKSLEVGEFAVRNGSALWIDHTSGTRQEVSDLNLVLKNVSFDQPIDIDLSARLDDKPLSLKGKVGPVGNNPGQGNIPLDIAVNVVSLALTLKGQLENPTTAPNMQLAIAIADFSPRKLVADLGQAFPVETADPKALTRLGLEAQISGGPERVAISAGVLRLDDSTLKFDVKASDFARPNLGFDVTLDEINLDRYMPPSTGEETGGTPSSEPASPKKTDYTPLRQMIVDGKLQIGSLTVSKAKLQKLLLQVKAKGGVIQLEPLQMALYEGAITGKGALDVKGKVPKTSVNLQVRGLQVNPLMQDVMEKDVLEGLTQADLALSMVGDDAASIKQTLNGRGKLTFEDGAIKGIDIANMVRNVKAALTLEKKPTAKPRTDFAAFIVPFTLQNGVFETSETSLQSPLLRLLAAGKVNLVQESLDMRLEPKVVTTIKGQGDAQQHSGVMVPILITGTFASPSIRPDLKGILQQGLPQDLPDPGKLKEMVDQKKLKEGLKDVTKGLDPKKGLKDGVKNLVPGFLGKQK